MNKSCQSHFIPGAVLRASDMDLKSGAAAQLLDLDHPLMKTRLETKWEPSLTFPIQKLPQLPALPTTGHFALVLFFPALIYLWFSCEVCGIHLLL